MSTSSASSSASEDSIMAASLQKIKEYAFHMKHALDNGKVLDALKHASDMLSELRTGSLGPKNYYELYVSTFEHLRFLEFFLYEETQKSGRRVKELYELVQYAGNILPRLYLLVTVGSVYIRSEEAGAKDVLHDLKEMCKGVQHPTRGLFLRSYLAEMTKDKMPEQVEDCISLTMENFVEMNKLWVRMQHQGGVRERAKREKERKELGPLIGKMLSRLSNLDHMSASLYQERVLPTIVEQITSCQDAIAQEYLLTCLVQVFPDEYHLRTLPSVLQAVEGLVEGVDVRQLLVSFIDRLLTSPLPPDAPEDLFTPFYSSVSRITAARPQLPPEHVLALYTALMRLTIQLYPESLDNVDRVFSSAAPVLAQRDEESLRAPRFVSSLLALLRAPVDNYRNILTVLRLENYPKLLTFLSLDDQRSLCLHIVRSVIRDAVPLESPEHAELLLELLSPIVRSELDADELDEEDLRDLAADQRLLGSLVHLMRNPDGLLALKQLAVARKFFGMGSTLRIQHTVPILLCRALQVTHQLHRQLDAEAWAQTAPRVFKFVLSTCKTFSEHVDHPNLAFRLFLLSAQTFAACQQPEHAYEFVSQAFSVYEESIPDSHDQVRAITLAIGALHRVLDSFQDEDSQDAALTKTTQHAKRVLKKGDQVLLISLVAHLFWRPSHQDPEPVSQCLKRSLKLATNLTEGAAPLLLRVLDKYIYYLHAGLQAISPEHLSSLLELIGGKITELADQDASDQFKRTLAYIRLKQQQEPDKWNASSAASSQ